MKKYCPKCGTLSFAYDYRRGVNRCLSVDCGIVDWENKYQGGLTEKPTKEQDKPKPDGLE